MIYQNSETDLYRQDIENVPQVTGGTNIDTKSNMLDKASGRVALAQVQRVALGDVTGKFLNGRAPLKGDKGTLVAKQEVYKEDSTTSRKDKLYSAYQAGDDEFLYESRLGHKNDKIYDQIHDKNQADEWDHTDKSLVIDDDEAQIIREDKSNKEPENKADGKVVVPLYPKVDEESQRQLEAAFQQYFSPQPNLDDEDTFDPVMVVEYSRDIFKYMNDLELKYRPHSNYMKFQTDLRWSYRSVLINWIVEVHEHFQLLPETLYLTINIMDRFLSKKIVTLNRFQLVGATALFIAAKYEEVNCPTLKDMLYILDNQFTMDEIVVAERYMIDTLNFELGWPGPMSFLRRLSKADDYDYDIRTLAKYFLESTIVDPRLLAAPPSWLAAGAYFLSKIILDDEDWSLKHVYYSGFTRKQLIPLVNAIVENCRDARNRLPSIRKKYSSTDYCCCAQKFEKWLNIYV